MEPFWMVYCPGHGAPQQRHETLAEAEAEARRIAAKERCDTFVMVSFGVASPSEPPTTWALIVESETQ